MECALGFELAVFSLLIHPVVNVDTQHSHQNPLLTPLLKSQPEHSHDVPSSIGKTCTTSSYGPGTCLVPSLCGAWFGVFSGNPDFKCETDSGKEGICCPLGDPNLKSNVIEVFGDEPVLRNNFDIRKVEKVELNEASEKAAVEFRRMQERAEALIRKGFRLNGTEPSSFHATFFRRRNPETLAEGERAFRSILAATNVAKRLNLSPNEAGIGLRQFSLIETSLADVCRGNVTCDPDAFFRTFDASCTNLEFPDWGRTNTPFNRALFPVYEDGIFTPRVKSANGNPLPSARKISAAFIPERNRPLNGITLLTVVFGQFVDHDITLGAIFSGPNNAMISCCTEDNRLIRDPNFLHHACFPIPVPLDDPFYAQFNVECLNFVRALPAQNVRCTSGFAQQINQINHVLDASVIYGSSEAEAKLIRGPGGKMLVTEVAGWDEVLLPQDRTPDEEECGNPEIGEFCFRAGEGRVNEQIVLTIVHTLFIREHNRIVDELKRINPKWDSDRLYFETRRIVNAQLQHIIYNEWLPLIIGAKAMFELGITPLVQGFSDLFDDSVNPTSSSEFVIAFRFGHTLLQGNYELLSERLSIVQDIPLRLVQNNPVALYRKGVLEGLLRGLVTEKSQTFDNSFTDAVQNFLFAMDKPFGLDLIALNIQRGRDHALPPYNAYREFCHRDKAKSFEDLLDSMSPEAVEVLKRAYDSVDDIDFFIGGVSENPVPGAIVGPTFVCIIGDYFARAKKGDRFFYDLGNQRHSFTPAQLNELRKVTMARIICNNVKRIRFLQPLVFYEASNVNNIVACDSYEIPVMNIEPWLEF
ncbi:unnamed protein product [Notodromas monacha]|uniref:Chorion peroxidase n=1 Tax=Notodromas monacha TaxID=399045 RepID=A0A7R9BD53_9CRUS|nr:unnamed protein product [Notodromas monacha]CAG0913170.1 unnamed protein product [Notodromas monacha]